MPTPTDPTVPKGVYSRREDDVIERIAQIVGLRHIPEGERHIGDDAAVLAPFVGRAVISTDVAVLGVHLDFEYFPLEDLGFKAVAAAVSDLAAMGARVRGAVVAVTAPEGTDLEELHRGMADASIVTSCPIVGGDLAQGRDVTVAVTVFGECPGGDAIYRSGAKPGDTLLVATDDVARLRLVVVDRGLRAPLAIGTVVRERATRTLQGEAFERRGWQHQL